MHAPLYSTITLLAELIVSSVVYYCLYQGYKHNRFPQKLVAAALLYEMVFNVSYMVSRVPSNEHATPMESVPLILLAITHGILSLVMFIALIVFFIIAWRSYRKGINYFALHKRLTVAFTTFWTISILSGILFYLLLYVF